MSTLEEKYRSADRHIKTFLELSESNRNGRRHTGRRIAFEFKTPSPIELKAELGRKWRVNVERLLILCKIIERSSTFDSRKEKYREFYLSVIDRGLMKHLGTKSHVSVLKLIRLAEKIGMLHCTHRSQGNILNAAMPSTFLYNEQLKPLLLNLNSNSDTIYENKPQVAAKTNSDTIYENKRQNALLSSSDSNSDTIIGDKRQNQFFNSESISEDELLRVFELNFKKYFECSADLKSKRTVGRFKKGEKKWLRFRKGNLGMKSVSDEEIKEELHKTYGGILKNLQEIIDHENRLLPDVLKKRAKIRIQRSRARKVEIEKSQEDILREYEDGAKPTRQYRTVGGMVTKISLRSTSPFCLTSYEERESVLRSMGFEHTDWEYDVKSSIYRVAYSIIYGKWLPNSVDFYEVLKPEGSTLDRQTFKKFLMRLMFSPSVKDVLHKLYPKNDGQGRNEWEDANADFEKKYEDIEWAVYSYFERYSTVMQESFGSELFLHESYIYEVLNAFLTDLGFKVAQVYDAFYYDDPVVPRIIETMLPVIAKYYRKMLGYELREETEQINHFIEKAKMYDLEIKNKITESIEGEFPEDEKAVESPSKFAWAMMPEEKPEEAPAVNQPSEDKKPAETPEELNREALEEVIRAATSDCFSDKPMMEKKEEDVMDVINSLEYRVADSKIDSG